MTTLSDHVLVLNKYFLAIQVTTAKDAICILYKKHAKVLDDYWKQYWFDEWAQRSLELSKHPTEIDKYTGEIRSPSLFVYSPQVIYLPHNEAESPEIKTLKFSRKSVLERDSFICQYCGKRCQKTEATLDHVIPKSRGGCASFDNIVTACKPCNHWKGGKTPEEAGMNLLKKPSIPKWKSFIGLPFSKIKREYWQPFIK